MWQLSLVPDVNDLGQVGFFFQTKKVNSRGHILFSLLASLFVQQSGQSFYIVLEA